MRKSFFIFFIVCSLSACFEKEGDQNPEYNVSECFKEGWEDRAELRQTRLPCYSGIWLHEIYRYNDYKNIDAGINHNLTHCIHGCWVFAGLLTVDEDRSVSFRYNIKPYEDNQKGIVITRQVEKRLEDSFKKHGGLVSGDRFVDKNSDDFIPALEGFLYKYGVTAKSPPDGWLPRDEEIIFPNCENPEFCTRGHYRWSFPKDLKPEKVNLPYVRDVYLPEFGEYTRRNLKEMLKMTDADIDALQPLYLGRLTVDEDKDISFSARNDYIELTWAEKEKIFTPLKPPVTHSEPVDDKSKIIGYVKFKESDRIVRFSSLDELNTMTKVEQISFPIGRFRSDMETVRYNVQRDGALECRGKYPLSCGFYADKNTDYFIPLLERNMAVDGYVLKLVDQ